MDESGLLHDLGADAVDECCERIASDLGIHLALHPDAYAQILCARTAVKYWEHADGIGLDIGEKRIRRQRFFTFVAQAYEMSAGYRAGVAWDRAAGGPGGEFFSMAKICHEILLPRELRADNDSALGKLIDRALDRRTSDHQPRKPPGRKRRRA
ncbi:MAG: hypothetical protein ABSC72_13880 [Methylovirgula sp.]|jgi:hypothetical protein